MLDLLCSSCTTTDHLKCSGQSGTARLNAHSFLQEFGVTTKLCPPTDQHAAFHFSQHSLWSANSISPRPRGFHGASSVGGGPPASFTLMVAPLLRDPQMFRQSRQWWTTGVTPLLLKGLTRCGDRQQEEELMMFGWSWPLKKPISTTEFHQFQCGSNCFHKVVWEFYTHNPAHEGQRWNSPLMHHVTFMWSFHISSATYSTGAAVSTNLVSVTTSPVQKNLLWQTTSRLLV